MKFSVVIPNYNSTVIDQTLAALRAQNFPKTEYEVIVVGKDDPNLIVEDELVKFDQTERPYAPAEARNRGAKASKGEIISFLDADCIPSPNWLHILNEIFIRNENIAVVGGGVRFYSKNYWNQADNIALFYEFVDTLPAGYRRQFPSLNLSFRRAIFLQVGGFDENYPKPAGEDFELTLRISQLGYPLWFEPDAWVMHNSKRISLKDLLAHAYMIGMYSTKVDPRYSDQIGFPYNLMNRYIFIFGAPVLALLVAFRLYIRTPSREKYLVHFPAVYLSKLAWCLGAAKSHENIE